MGEVKDFINGGIKKAVENYKNREYKDKKISTIKEDVQDEFKKVDKWGYRDDQEIWQAGMNIIDRYIWEMENQKLLVNGKENLYYKQAALKSFRESRNKLIKDYNAAKGLKLTTSAENRRLINDVAQRIDNAENEALRQIKYYCNPRQEQTNAIEASKKGKDEQGREIEQKPMFQEVQGDNRTFSLEFTDRTDKIPIHEALKGLFKKNYVYKIDYSNCKNERIKKKMMSLTGTGQCWIQFDEEKKTYLLKDKDGNALPQRALIWNGVRITRDKLITRDAGNRKKEQLSKLGNIDASTETDVSPEDDPKLKKYTKDLSLELKNKLKKLGNKEYRKFIIETEKRLNTILKEGKELGYELHSTPVAKLYVSSGLMEVKFVNDTAEKEVTIRENENTLGKRLYNLLDGNEDEYLEYLTKRVKEKRGEFDELTKRESLVDVKEDEAVKHSERLTIYEKSTTIYGLTLLNQFIENHRNTEGDSRADNGDKHLSGMIKQIRDLKYTIEEKSDVVKADVLRAAINELAKKLSKYWADYTHQGNTFEGIFIKILTGTKNEQISSIRSLSDKEALLDKTESSFLRGEIATGTVIEGEDGKPFMIGGIEIIDEEINKYFNNINEKLLTNIDYDPSGELIANEQIKNIDEIYEASKDGTGGALVTKLVELGMIPKEWENNKKIKEKCRNIAIELKSQAEIYENQSIYSLEKIQEQEKEEKLYLEMKDPKTDEDIKRLQAIEYLENNPEEAEEIHKKTIKVLKDTFKYQGINNLIRNELAPIFVDKGGGAKGENAKIYNDIVGYGRFNLSDNNAKTAGKVAKEIAITVATVIITQGVGSWVTGAMISGAQKFGSVNMANNVIKLINVGKDFQNATKGLKKAYTAYRIGSLMIEGTVFNAASKMIRNPLEGRKLFDDININPLTRENIQTAAFLGVLSFSNKFAGKIFNKAGNSNININFSKGLENYAAKTGKAITEFSAELTGMLAAEEAMNIVFGHEIIDPYTGKTSTEHRLTWPTTEERGTMIGLILAMKVVKPLTWPKIKDNLKIYRSRTKQWYIKTPSGKPVPLKEAANDPDIILEGENSNTPEHNNNGRELTPTNGNSRRTQTDKLAEPEEPEQGNKPTKKPEIESKEEADRKAKEEADRKAKEEADRKAKEEADRKAKEEADRKAQEASKKEEDEASKKAEEEANRKAREERLEEENFEIMARILNKTAELNSLSYRTKLDAEQLKYETENLKNKMSEILSRYKINEGYDPDIELITDRFLNIKLSYERILKNYQLINNELKINTRNIYEYGKSGRVFDRKQQKVLNELINQQAELKKTTDYLRGSYGDLEITMKSLKEMSSGTIYGVTTKYNGEKLSVRKRMANEIEKFYENGKYTANEINNGLNESKIYIDAIYQKSIQN